MISFIKQPNKYTPVNNPVIFQIQSDNPLIQFFKVTITDNLGNIIGSLRLFTTPDYLTGSFTDLSTILSNTVNYQLLPSANLVDYTPNILQAYQLTVTEKIYSNGIIVDGTTSTTGLFYVWNGLVDKVSFSSFDYHNYVLTTGNTANFLTNKPPISTMYLTSSEYLYFLNDGRSGNVNLNFYGAGNTLVGSHQLAISGSTSGATRIDISPAAITNTFGSSFANSIGREFGSMFTSPFGTNYSLSSANYFTVNLTDVSGNSKSVVRTYVLKNTSCKNTPVQIVFGNQLGGYDSFMFFNPRETLDVVKTSITDNPFSINIGGIYTDNNNSVFNEENTTINVNATSTYKVITDALRDEEVRFLKELVKSQKVYIRLLNGMFYPVTVTNLNFPVQQKKYTTSLLRLELVFTMRDTGINMNY
ncbi:hypothetical protein [Mucilaginibacter sp.]|uniref:hypothetical protein n=1 Tax=Mucilaginibacter sp. TaxID=1882438 RepID=UPI003D108532